MCVLIALQVSSTYSALLFPDTDKFYSSFTTHIPTKCLKLEFTVYAANWRQNLIFLSADGTVGPVIMFDVSILAHLQHMTHLLMVRAVLSCV
jgi:hypothetical protein